ncbi:COP23 domain-containing protein [Acaryochloris sp. IP29b_bin.148]|uniref:COP23 domain-containing protein n=1 Tax=Acaryochloris sp. IP29b_bin.148 TaxID=2969218 RepID=UPI002603C775|nr:COP23 domain-containing protein [Acaryochloris sp. IP29b_bin.148]
MKAMPKKSSLTQLFLAIIVVLSGSNVSLQSLANPGISNADEATATQSKRAKHVRYECAPEGQKFLTIAHTHRGPIKIIVWKSDYFGSQWNPARRCDVVTQRFQSLSDAKQLKYVSTGKLNNYNVICVSDKSGQCIPEGLLITLENSDDPDRVLDQLFDFNSPVGRLDEKIVVDYNRLLNERPIMEQPSRLPNTPTAAPNDEPIGDKTRVVPSELLGE